MTGARTVRLRRVVDHVAFDADDAVVVEEPLEIRLLQTQGELRDEAALAVTMRTPGDDRSLAVGFAYTEGLIRRSSDLVSVREAGALDPTSGARNTVVLELDPELVVPWDRLRRYGVVSSSCGVCGKTSLEAIQPPWTPARSATTPSFCSQSLRRWASELASRQSLFRATGGIHAAALFDESGTLGAVREDIGRHNALDKLIGAAVLDEALPWSTRGLFLSGRASFELLQKAAMAGTPLVAAVGAPSSLAIETAETFGMTLIGFLSEQRFNVYTHPERVEGPQQRASKEV